MEKEFTKQPQQKKDEPTAIWLPFTEKEISGLMSYFIDTNQGVKQFYALEQKIAKAKYEEALKAGQRQPGKK